MRSLDKLLFLSDTDTIKGFISKDSKRLNVAKKRDQKKLYIKAVDSLQTLSKLTRVPPRYKKMVRRAKKSSFIFANSRSFRVIYQSDHLLLISRVKWAYTTSANISGKSFDKDYANRCADVIVSLPKSSQKVAPSKIYKLGASRVLKLR